MGLALTPSCTRRDEEPDASIALGKNILLLLPQCSSLYSPKTITSEEAFPGRDHEYLHLRDNFCGTVVDHSSGGPHKDLPCLQDQNVYLCGDLHGADIDALAVAENVFVVKEFSKCPSDFGCLSSWRVVGLGQVPVLVHGLGIFFRRLFAPDAHMFHRIKREHVFQSLTESNKPGIAHRTGIYLSPVSEDSKRNVHFNLLRCSSNFSGPTESFGFTDWHIIHHLNRESNRIFQGPAPLNHVLAQIYHNHPQVPDKSRKQTKAKIKAHADKTKDMPTSAPLSLTHSSSFPFHSISLQHLICLLHFVSCSISSFM